MASATAEREVGLSRFGFSVMVKPIGPVCNLDCTYCYYLEKESLYPETKHWRMRDELLERYIRQHIDAFPPDFPEITFAWQGGEPTLMGVDFFRRTVEIQRRCCGEGTTINNALQTNGTLLNDEWCQFFKENNFLIGLSIDGPADLNDAYRIDKEGKPTFDAVIAALTLLQRYQVEYNILCTVHKANQDHGSRIYQFFKSQGIKYIQFIPIVERIGETDRVSDRSVGSGAFGRFLTSVFDEWIKNDVGEIFVQTFDETLRCMVGVPEGLCVFNKTCGKALAMEHNGDVYSCDHFVTPEYKVGNINEQPLLKILNNERQAEFGRDKFDSLPQYCLQCEFLKRCYGECPKNRFIRTPDGQEGLNYLCEGLKTYFSHTKLYFERMAGLLSVGRPPSEVMRPKFPPLPVVRDNLGANSACPCGSGRKYKRCCGRKR